MEPGPGREPESEPEHKGPKSGTETGTEPGAEHPGAGPGAEDPGADPVDDPGADPGADPVDDPGAGPGADPVDDPGADDPGAGAGSDPERHGRIAARRARLEARRRGALGEAAEQEEPEEEREEERKSLRLLQETEELLAKLLFHGTRLLTDVRAGADLREWRRREKDGQEERSRLEKLEAESKRGTERLAEINSRWGLAGDLRIPRELWDLLEQQQEQCQRLLQEKNRLIRELQQELKVKDEEYEQALKEQAEEIQVLLERMEEQTRNVLKSYRHHLRQIEKSFEEERRELLVNNRKRWDEAIQAHHEQELEFLRERLEQARERARVLGELREQSTESGNSVRERLERDIELLERQLHLFSGRSHLAQVQLEFNLAALRGRYAENAARRARQKRQSQRLRSRLSLLRARLSRQRRRFRDEKQNLAAELERLAGLCRQSRSRARDLARGSAARFRRVWLANEEEAKARIREALAAGRIIHGQLLGIPWEEPSREFLENVGPLGGRREEEEEAMEVVMELLEGFEFGNQEGRGSKKKGPGSGKGGKEIRERVEERATSRPNTSRKTLRKILELLSEETGFLVENKLLKPLREVVGTGNRVRQLRAVLETLRIEDGDELRKLLDFFLFYESQAIPAGGDPADPAPDSRRDELQGPGSPIPDLSIRADEILRILREFLRDFQKLRDEGPPKEIQDSRDSSRDGEYWECLTRVIPERTLRLWDALGAALPEYHKVLARRAELFSEATALQRQNSELGMLLEEYLGSGQGP